MRFVTLVAGSIVAVFTVGALGSTSLSAQSAPRPDTKAASAVSDKSTSAVPRFATLSGVKAAPMASSELKAVKGLHVHFLDAGGGKLHLAGDIKTENNWSNEWGGIDGKPV